MRIQQLAREGLQRQGGQSFPNARKIGDSYLGSIAREATGNERIVARTAIDASAHYMYDQSAYQGHLQALQALAAGVPGPIGPTLARVGRDSMHKTVWFEASRAYKDGRAMGETYLDAIASHGSATERALAAAAREATNPKLFNQSAFQVQSEALRRIQNGVGQDVPATLAGFGREARMKCLDNENARSVGAPILWAITSHGDARQKAVADTAAEAAARHLHHDVASLAQDVGFVKILEAPKGTIAQDLADLGTRSLKNCKLAEDQRSLGHGVLRGIVKHAVEPGVRKFAQVADDATCPHLYNFSAAGAHYDAFTLIASGETDGERLMARFGQAILERGQTIGDGRTMGQVVLEAMYQNAADSVKKGVLEAAITQATAAPNAQVAAGVQRFAFNWVEKAPSIPKPQGTDDSADQAVLEQRIGLHESIKTMLTDELASQGAQISDKQVRMGALADQFNPLVPVDHKLIRNRKIARVAFFVGAATLIGGLIAGQNAVLLGGGILAFGSHLAAGSIEARRKPLLDKFWSLRNAYDQVEGEQQALQAASTATRAMIEPLEKAIQADRSRIEVVKIHQGVKPPSTTTIGFDRQAVTIGGVRIAKRARVEDDRLTPAVPAPD